MNLGLSHRQSTEQSNFHKDRFGRFIGIVLKNFTRADRTVRFNSLSIDNKAHLQTLIFSKNTFKNLYIWFSIYFSNIFNTLEKVLLGQ